MTPGQRSDLTPTLLRSLLFKVEGFSITGSILEKTHPLHVALLAGFFNNENGLLDMSQVCDVYLSVQT